MARITVRWDMESVKFDNGFDPLRSREAIESGLRNHGFSGEIVSIKAYAEKESFPQEIINRLELSGVEFECVVREDGRVYEKDSQVADERIVQELYEWAKQSQPPEVMVVMSCDSRFLDILLEFEEQGFETCIVYATGNITKTKVQNAPIQKLRWVEDILDKAPYVNPLNYGLAMAKWGRKMKKKNNGKVGEEACQKTNLGDIVELTIQVTTRHGAFRVNGWSDLLLRLGVGHVVCLLNE